MPVGTAQRSANIFGQIGSVIHHRHDNAVDGQLGIDAPPHHLDVFDQGNQALEGEMLGLNRDQHTVRGGQCPDGQHPEAGHTVDQAVVIAFFQRFQHIAQNRLTAHYVGQAHIHARQLDV